MLPVKLPQIDLNVKGNPLDSQKEWKEITINGKKLKRETDTLDTLYVLLGIFLDSVHPRILNTVLIRKILIIGCQLTST